MQDISKIRREFISGHLRTQLNSLKWLLDDLENEITIDSDYTYESLREAEINLRKLRLNINAN
ncbi:MAG: hypothetical protein HQL27_04640 [Candidatus Omnitrophica bacterium]|nr:hypothetical protein [Candidatus Omnitrophota bacterium]